MGSEPCFVWDPRCIYVELGPKLYVLDRDTSHSFFKTINHKINRLLVWEELSVWEGLFNYFPSSNTETHILSPLGREAPGRGVEKLLFFNSIFFNKQRNQRRDMWLSDVSVWSNSFNWTSVQIIVLRIRALNKFLHLPLVLVRMFRVLSNSALNSEAVY